MTHTGINVIWHREENNRIIIVRYETKKGGITYCLPDKTRLDDLQIFLISITLRNQNVGTWPPQSCEGHIAGVYCDERS